MSIRAADQRVLRHRVACNRAPCHGEYPVVMNGYT